MAVWFCGRAEVSSLFGGAQLSPTKCYFSATITVAELRARGMRYWTAQEDCSCTPQPPPPPPPPSKIYFCGESEVWHLFDYKIEPTSCYFSYEFSKEEVADLGVDVYLDSRQCICKKPPPPSPPAPSPPGTSHLPVLSLDAVLAAAANATEPSPLPISTSELPSALALEAPPRKAGAYSGQAALEPPSAISLVGVLAACALLAVLLSLSRHRQQGTRALQEDEPEGERMTML